MREGLSFESFGGICGVSKQTLYAWAEANPEFLDAKHQGLEAARLYWEKLGRDYVISTSETQTGIGGSSKSLNSSVYSLTMKNRFGWRDKQPDEVTQINLNVGSMTDEELLKIVEDYGKKAAK